MNFLQKSRWQTVVKLLLLGIYVLLSIRHIHDYAWNYDEGVLLQTAALSHRGYQLYGETVLNKPPLFIWWIQLAFTIGGVGVVQARLAVLLVTSVSVWLLGELAKSWWGRGSDILAMVFYLLIPETIVRANVVMNDLPAMGMMLAALLTATYFYKRPHWIWAIITGVFYGIGIGLHPMLLFMAVPIGLLLIWQPGIGWQWSHVIKTGLLVSGTAVFITTSWLILVDWQGFWQWVILYNRAPLDASLQAYADNNIQRLAEAHFRHGYLLIPALFAYVWLWQQKESAVRFSLIVVAVWYGSIMFTLATLQPMWKHYTLFAFIPLILVFSGALWRSMQSQYNNNTVTSWALWLSGIVFLLFGLFLPRNWQEWEPINKETMHYLQETIPADAFVIADNPYLLFVSNKLIPPPLADGSGKRISTQLLHASDIMQTAWQYRVTNVVLTNGRFQRLLPLLGWLDRVGTPIKMFGDMTVVQIPPAPAMDINLDAVFKDTIILEGATVAIRETRVGWVVEGTLFLQTTAPLLTDYTLFVHLLDEDGNLVAQYDGTPQYGWLPTSTWIPNQPVLDTFQLQLPPGTASGIYTLTTGMYTLPDVRRLPVRSLSGVDTSDNVVPITQLSIIHEP